MKSYGDMVMDAAADLGLVPKTTLPPGPESVSTAEFERTVEEKGEEDARREHLAKVFKPPCKSEPPVAEFSALASSFMVVGPNARKILLDIAKRLEKGAQQYGDFDGENAERDWDQETYEEHLDAVVYQAVKRLRK